MEALEALEALGWKACGLAVGDLRTVGAKLVVRKPNS